MSNNINAEDVYSAINKSKISKCLTWVLFEKGVRSLKSGVIPVQCLVEDGHHPGEESRKA